jgi:hemolysin III
MYLNHPRDKWSFRTHLAGAFLGVIITISLVLTHQDHFLPYLVFGLSVIALYSCSALYHYVQGPPELVQNLRKLDHTMIFVLIAGTYTPILVLSFPPTKAMIYMIVMWGVTVLGAIMKMVWLQAPRWLYTLLYVAMGWAAVGEIPFFFHTSPPLAIWIVAGGLSYTLGAVFYALKKPNPSTEFGFHEIFHVLIIGGTVCHWVAIANYLS